MHQFQWRLCSWNVPPCWHPTKLCIQHFLMWSHDMTAGLTQSADFLLILFIYSFILQWSLILMTRCDKNSQLIRVISAGSTTGSSPMFRLCRAEKDLTYCCCGYFKQKPPSSKQITKECKILHSRSFDTWFLGSNVINAAAERCD